MTLQVCRFLLRAASCLSFIVASSFIALAQQTTEISSTPSSLTFANTYVGKAAGSKVLTINNLTTSGSITIETVAFDCPGAFGISSGIAPFQLGQFQKITHYSVFFQPTAAQTYNCNFVITLNDGTFLDVPVTGTGLTSTATASVSPSTLNFSQSVGSTSSAQTVTITNTGTGSMQLNSIALSPPSFTTNSITFPVTINAGSSFPVSVYYTPSQAISETGAIDFDYNSVPDNGVTLNGSGVAASQLTVNTSPTLPQATQSAAYQANLTASGGTGPYAWALANGSTLPLGLSVSSAGVISGTLDPSIAVGTYTFTVQVTDSSNNATANSTLSLGVFANLGDNCNDVSFNVTGTSTPIVALTDLGTGTYQGSEGGLYPNGSNVRPASHDSDGLAIAQNIVPLDANGNYSPTGKYVFMAIGESTAQNEFNRFMPIANADPAKSPYLVIVNGAQGGATPNNFTSTTSAYWSTVLNNYLPQSGVTANQVVAIWLEDTDGIASGTFPTDISALQTQYETMMQTMLTLFPNLKLVYFSSRVYGGYSNGVGNPDNPEPYAYEVGFAVKWSIQDQLNGNSNLNYNPANGPVVAPWMSWGPYYWSNGMLGRNDGMVWDCEDFSADGTHPSSTYGQLKVATQLLNFLKTDETTTPWYLTPNKVLAATSGGNQTGNASTVLPTPLTVTATNNGSTASGISVTFSDGGVGGSFNPTTATTGSNGTVSTSYTLPPTAQLVTVSATANGYAAASFTETATASVQTLAVSGGNNQSGNAGTALPTALSVLATTNGNATAGVNVTFNDGGAGGSFNPTTAVSGSNGIASTIYTLPSTAQTVTVSATSSGYSTATFSETATANVLTLAVNGGNNQSAPVSTTLPTALSVLATTNGNATSGVSVTFNDGGVGGSFNPATAISGSNGIASTIYTLPPTAQTVTINATSSGYTGTTFTETATANVQTLAVNGGNNQRGVAGSVLPTTLTVLATKNGTAASGVSVTFSDGGVGGSFNPAIAVTGSNGIASTSYTLPGTAQTITINATSSGYSTATFTETATANSHVLAVSSGNNQTGTAGQTLPLPLTVSATVNGRATSGVVVTFSDGGAGGTFGTPTATTGSTGKASSTYTLPATAGTFTITVTSSGYTTANFTETANSNVVTTLTVASGGKQIGTVGTTLPLPLVITAKNSSGKVVVGAPISFTDGGAGGSFNPASGISNSKGQVSTSYTLPTVPKSVTVTASDGGVSVKTTEQSVAGAPTNFTIVAGNNQTGNRNTTLTKKLVVLLTDQYNNPISGATVTFTDNGAGGTFSTTTPVTNAFGQASVTYTTGSTAGTVTISATTSTLGPLNFTETVK